MTTTNIDEMSAGREMDTLVAQHITEWIPPEERDEQGRRVKKYSLCPHYSTNIAAAWEVQEKIGVLRGGDMELVRYSDGGYGCWFSKQISGMAGGCEFIISATADTAPLAICRAALKTKS
jgi:hypothetical protein